MGNRKSNIMSSAEAVLLMPKMKMNYKDCYKHLIETPKILIGKYRLTRLKSMVVLKEYIRCKLVVNEKITQTMKYKYLGVETLSNPNITEFKRRKRPRH